MPEAPGSRKGQGTVPPPHPRAVRGSVALGHLDLGRLGPTLRKEAFRRLEPPRVLICGSGFGKEEPARGARRVRAQGRAGRRVCPSASGQRLFPTTAVARNQAG